MAFTTRQAASEDRSGQEAAAKPSVQLFNDQRASTATQLKQQQMMTSSQSTPLQRAEDEELLQGKFAPAQLMEEEEPLQGKFVAQRVEEEEPLQGKFATAQLMEEEEPIQGKFEPLQRAAEEEELLQGKFSSDATAQREQKPNNTGMPDNLKSGIENLSGYAMDDVKVHYNSAKPAQLNAHAYAQGTDIHIAPGQEQHLPHEAWHVVQQKQGRVQPTMQMKAGVPVNDDAGLEHEADVMGAKANLLTPNSVQRVAHTVIPAFQNYQLKRVYQLAPTTIDYGNLQEFVFDGVSGFAGSKMQAHLNPTDVQVGSDTGGSTAFSSLFNKLQSSTASTWVRGHLLNHDLGGDAHYNNLFPITTAANNEHKYEVEYPVKHWLENGCEIDYHVTAKKTNTGDTDADGVFECWAQVTAGANKYQGKRVQKNIQSKTQKVTSNKRYRNKSNQSRNGFVQVDYGQQNNVMRDDYKTHGVTPGWAHTGGNVGNNYFFHEGEIFPGDLANSTNDVAEVEQEYQAVVLNFLSEYEVIGKKLDADLLNDIVEFVESEANDHEEGMSLFKEELEDAGYILKKR